jgi:hypothetical protein
METAIGVFSTRDQAEQAVRALKQRGVPQESIVFMNRSDSAGKARAEHFGATVGGFVGMGVGMSAGIVTGLRFPNVEAMIALGFSAAGLLGFVGACVGALVARAIVCDAQAPLPTSNEQSSEDADLFRDTLSEGQSLIVVRTEAREIAAAACDVLDRGAGI